MDAPTPPEYCELLNSFFDVWQYAGFDELRRQYTVNQFRVLLRVYAINQSRPQDDGITLKVLAGDLNVSAAAASEMVKNLTEKDMLRCRRSKSDRRAVRITLSRKCARLFAKCETRRAGLLAAALSGIPDEECSCFFSALKKIHQSLGARPKGGLR